VVFFVNTMIASGPFFMMVDTIGSTESVISREGLKNRLTFSAFFFIESVIWAVDLIELVTWRVLWDDIIFRVRLETEEKFLMVVQFLGKKSKIFPKISVPKLLNLVEFFGILHNFLFLTGTGSL